MRSSRRGRSGTVADRLEDPALRSSQGCRFAFLPATGPAQRSPGLQQAGLWDRRVGHRELSINDFPCGDVVAQNKGVPRKRRSLEATGLGEHVRSKEDWPLRVATGRVLRPAQSRSHPCMRESGNVALEINLSAQAGPSRHDVGVAA